MVEWRLGSNVAAHVSPLQRKKAVQILAVEMEPPVCCSSRLWYAMLLVNAVESTDRSCRREDTGLTSGPPRDGWSRNHCDCAHATTWPYSSSDEVATVLEKSSSKREFNLIGFKRLMTITWWTLEFDCSSAGTVIY